MEVTPTDEDEPRADVEVHSCPTLRQLGLSRKELEALRRKGYLTQDDRGHGHEGYWRLRFRLDGRARTVYLGRDARLVAAVRQELNELQQERDQIRRIAQVAANAKKSLKDAKRRLEPVLHQLGFHYHGDVVRKKRGDKKVSR